MKILCSLLVSSVLISCDGTVSGKTDDADSQYLAVKLIADAPLNYLTEPVWVKGVTTQATKTPFFSVYKLSDKTGDIWVQTNQPLPKEKSQVYLKALVDNVFSFKESSLGLSLIEIERIAVIEHE